VVALTTAWLDFAIRFVKQHLPGRPIGMGPDALWMGPLMNFAWLASALLLVMIGARLRPRWFGLSMVLRVLVAVALACVFLMFRRVHASAELVLALGIAVALEPWLTRRADAIERFAPRFAGVAIFVYASATVLTIGGRMALERRASASLPAARDGAPNVLLLVLDTVRSMNLSLYGYPRATTPHLSAWAAQGARFEHAFATAPWTLPSHAGMFTGRLPHELTADLRVPLDDQYPTLAEVLRGAGYATASIVGNISYCTQQFGLTRGFAHTDGYPVSWSMFVTSSALGRRLLWLPVVRRLTRFWDIPGRKSAARVNGEFLKWLDGSRRRPWFAFLNYYDAHFPSLPPAPFDTLFGPRPSPRAPEMELVFGAVSIEELQRRVAQYDGAIAYMDAQLDSLLRELRRRGVLDNTIVVIVSDHGEHWGDHARLSHGNSLYRQLLEVPLVIRYPARVEGGTIERAPASLRDLPSTILAMAGVTNHGIVGAPFAALVGGSKGRDGASEEAPIVAGLTPRGHVGPISVLAHGMHYIATDAREELFDVAHDPLDEHDLAATSPTILPAFRAIVDSLRGTGRPR
jgi:arylsulfatase A-like enzyme